MNSRARIQFEGVFSMSKRKRVFSTDEAKLDKVWTHGKTWIVV